MRLQELRHSANVVVVIVRDQHVVDLREAGAFGSCDNTVSVTAVVAGPSGVDEQRFSSGSDEECRLAAFNVDEVDLQLV